MLRARSPEFSGQNTGGERAAGSGHQTPTQGVPLSLQLVTERHMHGGNHLGWDKTAGKRQLERSPLLTQDAGVISIPLG